ncbi:MAG: SDR family oxidoreductase [Colwellia sp.]|jgi:Nucleoside-diphosphate-sugar epimerases
MNVLVTGANGFVGSALINDLMTNSSYRAVAAARASEFLPKDVSYINVKGLSNSTDWSSALANVSIVIHTAARVHIMKDKVGETLNEYRKVNVEGTLNLARQSAKSGVKRFIFISSIKVNGESTTNRNSFNELDDVSPIDPYGQSKWEAEKGLQSISIETGMEVVIIRPPLVYGPQVKANFHNLLKLAKTGLPLPFGAIQNLRSTVFIGNLVDFIVNCIDHPNAANETFLISDGEDLSISMLLMQLRSDMGIPPRLIPVPKSLFMLAGKILGKSDVVARLCGSLQVDSTKAQQLLGWVAPYTVQHGLKVTVDNFLKIND